MGSVAYLEPVYSAAFARSNIIELKALSKNFGELKVLENIDFAIREGEIFAIIGTSGSGKSTFLNIISGLLEQDSGSFAISGKASGSLPAGNVSLTCFRRIACCPGARSGITSLSALKTPLSENRRKKRGLTR